LISNENGHQLLKEIREQPSAIMETLAQEEHEIERAAKVFPRSVRFLGMGSSYYASLYAKYLLEEYAHMDVPVDLSSEFLHYPPHVRRGEAFVVISQSGESVETVKVVRFLRKKHASVTGVTNRPESSLAALADKVLLTHAGEERASATKTFTSTLALLHRLALSTGVRRGFVSRAGFSTLSSELIECAQSMRSEMSEWERSVKRLVARLREYRSVTVLGRGYNLASALQGALLLKEVAKLHAEGMSAGEFMHGPMEIASQELLAVVLTGGRTSPLMRGLVGKLKGYGTEVLTIGPESVGSTKAICFREREQTLVPIPSIVCLDLLTYFLALKRRLNPDTFRHISKVTLAE
jgi:glucosamine--fructose-6-phosphate aminotransferase (isomerizing)